MVIDHHFNLLAPTAGEECVQSIVESMDRNGIDKVICQRVLHARPVADFDAETARRENRILWETISRAPDRLMGVAVVNPSRGQAMLDMFRECAEEYGLVGFKLWVAGKCSDPACFPFVEYSIEQGKVCYIHTYLKNPLTADGRMGRSWEKESWPEDVVALAERYPEATLLAYHFGGQFIEGPAMFRGAPPNVYLGVSNLCEVGTVEHAATCVGADHLVWGTDCRRFSVRKLIERASLSESDKRLILGDTLARLLSGGNGSGRRHRDG